MTSDPLKYPREIHTQRLTLRQASQADGPHMAELVKQNQDHLKMWLPFAAEPSSAEEYSQLMDKWRKQYEDGTDFNYLVGPKGGGDFFGSAGFWYVDQSVPSVEIGYWLAKSHVGQGLITEAVEGIIEFARTHFQPLRIQIRVDTGNHASRAVAERAGFTLEGILRSDSLHHITKEPRDTAIYAKIFSNLES